MFVRIAPPRNLRAAAAFREEAGGLFLLSRMDVLPRSPVVEDDGNYLLHFKAFCEGFPLLKFGVRLHLRRGMSSVCKWDDSSGDLVLQPRRNRSWTSTHSIHLTQKSEDSRQAPSQ